jgi:uroporphyrinogen decarboxylase
VQDVDLQQFWKDDEAAHRENCFSKEAPQAALGIRMSGECVFAELGEEGQPWGVTAPERRLELNKRYNEKAVRIVGKPLLPEEPVRPKDSFFPPVKRIGEVFGGRYFMHNDTEWLEGSVKTPEELEKLLDSVDRMDLRSFLLPPGWEKEKLRIREKYGLKPEPVHWVRGPVTLATSIYGAENLIYLIYDEPDLARRFSDTICRVIIAIADLMDEEAGYQPGTAPHGFRFADDNCALLTPEMYEMFGFPVLKKVFAKFSPEEGDTRYQHSDSAMGHLLPILGRLNLNGCNFGPTVSAREIRRYLPRTRIDGCIAPFTFMSNDENAVIAEVKRDCEGVGETRGLNVSTAGSINNGSLLTSMRAVMYAIQRYGRY